MNALYPVIAAILGALLYAFSTTKAAELGRLLFMGSVFALMFALCGRSVHLF